MKRILFAFVFLCLFHGCASSNGGGYVVGNGFAPMDNGAEGENQACKNGHGQGCKKGSNWQKTE